MTRQRSNRSGFEQRLVRVMRELDVSTGARLTIGFSGGRDSLALSSALARVAPLFELEILLVHVDHRLRSASGEHAVACRDLATHIGVPIIVVPLEPGLRERGTGLGLEEAARRERYAALATAASEWDSQTLVLGHQANDQAETVLMHLFRGAGLDGLAGMRPRERRRIPWWNSADASALEFDLMRPLLAETRGAIDSYVAQTGLRPLDDESNELVDFDRNWVRHRVLPPILERWTGAIGTIQRSSQALNLDRRLLDGLAADAFASAVRNDRSLCTDMLRKVDVAVALRVLRSWLGILGLVEISLDVVARLYDLVLSEDQQRVVEVGEGRSVVIEGSRLTTLHALLTMTSEEMPLELSGEYSKWKVDFSSDIRDGDVVLFIPAEAKLRVRTIEEGDRWTGTQRSVMDDLRTSGIHPQMRTRLLAVTSDQGVLLIPAIYPTIHSARSDGPGKRVGVRWSKRS